MSVGVRDHDMVVGGAWAESESGARFDAWSPATGEPLGTLPEGTRQDAARAIAAANDGWRDWAGRSAFERAAALERVADLVEERRDDLAETLTRDQGKPLHAEARQLLAGFARWQARHEPRATNRAADALANLALDDPAAAAALEARYRAAG